MILDSPPSDCNQLSRDDTFPFSCHPGLECFNTCCGNKHLSLTPYDMIRMKRALDMHSDAFLNKYVVYRAAPDSGFPILSVKMGKADKRCPFVDIDGCSIYEDRPMACRLYPLGRSSTIQANAASALREFFYLLDTPGCEGVEENEIQRVEEWTRSQGLLPYIELNDQMLTLFFHPRRDRARPLHQKQQQKILVACYNTDLFRELVATRQFIEMFKIEKETLKRVQVDDVALLRLGFAYLRRALFG
ncbi:MAG: YkgJ family cysteine cluster protein [Deltaproteobacteria bacterium]|nr:YkgJ family cysteine cluster protein [Deltaproteobacteria bacterium]